MGAGAEIPRRRWADRMSAVPCRRCWRHKIVSTNVTIAHHHPYFRKLTQVCLATAEFPLRFAQSCVQRVSPTDRQRSRQRATARAVLLAEFLLRGRRCRAAVWLVRGCPACTSAWRCHVGQRWPAACGRGSVVGDLGTAIRAVYSGGQIDRVGDVGIRIGFHHLARGAARVVVENTGE